MDVPCAYWAWTMLLGVLGGVSLSLVLFLVFDIRIPFSKALIERARCVSVYGCRISLQRKNVQLSVESGEYTILLTCSYPRFYGFSPLKLTFGRLSVVCRDNSVPSGLSDFSKCRIDAPRVSLWIQSLVLWLLRWMRPVVTIGDADLRYIYLTRDGFKMTTVGKFEGVTVDMIKSLLTSTIAEIVLSQTRLLSDEILLKVECSGRSSCEVKSFSEVDISVETVKVQSFLMTNLTGLLTSLNTEPFNSESLIPSAFEVRVNVNVRNKIRAWAHLQDKSTCVNSEIEFGGSSRNNAMKGSFFSVIFDPFSLLISGFTVHNVAAARKGVGSTAGMKQINVEVAVRGMHLLSILLSNSTLIGEYSRENNQRWSLSGRTQSLSVSLFDKSGRDNMLELKSASLSGSNTQGLSLLISYLDVDASSRMLSKLARVYLKFSSVLESELSPETTSRMSQQSTLMIPSVSEPSFLILRRKFFAASSSVVSQKKMKDSETPSKNWRSNERVKFVDGGPVLSLGVEKIQVSNKDLLVCVLNKFKATAKISSTGSRVSTVCLERCAINENVVMKEGMRIWIDGQLFSEFAKVFCLVPPITITFDPKFAAIVERYLLELVEVLKLVVVSNRATAAASSKNFIEFLQISSLQLELHAKEMLGVLALDKAMIHLTRSSVYKSNGLADALNSLALQYREELVGQWLSLLMRLDVSIGRPVSTARKLVRDLFTRERK